MSTTFFDPRSVPVSSVDAHLPAIPASVLQASALTQRFAQPLADWKPEIHGEPRFTNRAPAEAAVLIPLVVRAQGLQVLLTERSRNLSSHSGQISFPGGKIDPEDASPIHAALREAEEEIGLHANHIAVIGSLPIYVTGSAFIVTPVVALVAEQYHVTPNPHEVADVFEVPLDFLMNPAHHRRHTTLWDGKQREWLSMPYYDPLQQTERYIWGATAGMLRNFYRFLSVDLDVYLGL